MRITGGIAKGIPLKSVKEEILRPATDYIREAVFSSLATNVIGQRFLDLFCGVGSYGLESISRGSQGGIFIDNNRRIVSALQQNITAVGKNFDGIDLKIELCDVFKWLKVRQEYVKSSSHLQFGLIFLDPPYDIARDQWKEIFDLIDPFLLPNGHLIFEMPVDLNLPEISNLELKKRIEKKGKNSPAVSIFRKK